MSLRPVVVLEEEDAPLFRLPLKPNERNRLHLLCPFMVDKITTVPKFKVGIWIGRLDDEDIVRLNQAVLVLLGLVGSRKATTQQAKIFVVPSTLYDTLRVAMNSCFS